MALCRRTRISQKLPDKTQEQLENFHQFVKSLRIEKSFELGNILNMDETPVWFDMAGVYTINPKGEKTVHIRATGNEKNRFTVVLTCAAGIVLFFSFSAFLFFPILTIFFSSLHFSISDSFYFFNSYSLIILQFFRRFQIPTNLYL